MRSTHPYLFQKASAKRRQTVFHYESKGKVAQPHEHSTLDIDVSLHGGIPPGRPPDLQLMRDILYLGSSLLDFGEVKSLEEKFGMGDFKVVDNNMRIATHARSSALSLMTINPY